MNTRSSRFDKSYLEMKRQELTRLREALRYAALSAESEEAEVQQESNSQAREYEDGAQELDMLETAAHLVVTDTRRLARVERALQKIADGTYGISDVSGQRIPNRRLEVMPEAIDTLLEQQISERSGNSPG
jgi:DnaK suppressor protein